MLIDFRAVRLPSPGRRGTTSSWRIWAWFRRTSLWCHLAVLAKMKAGVAWSATDGALVFGWSIHVSILQVRVSGCPTGLPKELIWKSLGGLSVLLVARTALFRTHVMACCISPFSWLGGSLSPTGQFWRPLPRCLVWTQLSGVPGYLSFFPDACHPSAPGHASSAEDLSPPSVSEPPDSRPVQIQIQIQIFFPSSAHIPHSYSNCMGLNHGTGLAAERSICFENKRKKNRVWGSINSAR